MSLDVADLAPLMSPPSDDLPSAAPALRQVVTGNRLRDGIPVYFAGDGRWSPDIDHASHVASVDAENLLAAAQRETPHPVVGPYLVEVTVESGQLRPVTLRERIRAFGPTVGPRP